MPRHLNTLDEIGGVKSLSHLVWKPNLLGFRATCLEQGTPLIGNVCTTLKWKHFKGTRLMAVPNGKNQAFLPENPVSSI